MEVTVVSQAISKLIVYSFIFAREDVIVKGESTTKVYGHDYDRFWREGDVIDKDLLSSDVQKDLGVRIVEDGGKWILIAHDYVCTLGGNVFFWDPQECEVYAGDIKIKEGYPAGITIESKLGKIIGSFDLFSHEFIIEAQGGYYSLHVRRK
jgi:hypothetical protein